MITTPASGGFIAPAATLGASSATTGLPPARSSARSWSLAEPDLPLRLPLGVATVYDNYGDSLSPKQLTISARVPLPPLGQPWVVLDMAAMRFDEILPHRAIIGDGSAERAFIGIDKRPGTPLDAWVNDIFATMPRPNEHEAVIEWLRTNLNALLGQASELPWDKWISPVPSEAEQFRAAADLTLGAPARPSNITQPVVALERYLEVGQGYCIQKSLLGSILLERCGIAHRVVMGATLQSGSKYGHTWLELADGRVLDPTWEKIEPKGPTHRLPRGAFSFSGELRFPDQSYPYVAWPT
jgi:hypothetical protein